MTVSASRRIPLFPLPGVVLMPGTLLPLHIFEPRYRAMVSDALAGDRTIGMAMLYPGWESGGDDPRIYAVGGAGEIVESEELEDGRYNILLEGRFRYRVVEEAPANPYRVARVEEIRSVPFPDSDEEQRVTRAAAALFGNVARELELPPLPDEVFSTERLASEIALRLRYTPPELQALLETDSLASRFQTLTGRMLEWKGRVRFLAPFRPADLDPRRN
ncbi:MAG: LON peptidase substrate-binding domain-containing protein [Thermoanaerobaculia bacterium]